MKKQYSKWDLLKEKWLEAKKVNGRATFGSNSKKSKGAEDEGIGDSFRKLKGGLLVLVIVIIKIFLFLVKERIIWRVLWEVYSKIIDSVLSWCMDILMKKRNNNQPLLFLLMPVFLVGIVLAARAVREEKGVNKTEKQEYVYFEMQNEEYGNTIVDITIKEYERQWIIFSRETGEYCIVSEKQKYITVIKADVTGSDKTIP